MIKNDYKIGIDFHGVITSAPELFKAFNKEIRQLKIKIHIISGGPVKDIKNYLDAHNIEYDEIWAILDYYQEKGLTFENTNQDQPIPTELWDKAKADYCAKENIKIHIDDSTIYGTYFQTPYCCYNETNNTCIIANKKIDFRNAKTAAQTILSLLK